VARVIVWLAIALTPAVLVADYVFDVTGTAADGRSRRSEGFALLALYALVVGAFGAAGDR
jgi:Ca2+/H+ antiporter